MDEHGVVVFGGDGYSTDWHEEATSKRGLENLRNTSEALHVLQRDDIRDLFARHQVISPVELQSRFAVYAEQYVLAIEVEARVALSMVRTQIAPAVEKHVGSLAHSLRQQSQLGLEPDQRGLLELSDLQRRLQDQCAGLAECADALPHSDPAQAMIHCAASLLPRLEQLRAIVDSLEQQIDDDHWPLPSYREMLFVR